MPTEQSHHRHSLAGPDHCAGAGRSWIPAIVMRPAAGDHALVVVSVRMRGRGAIPGLPAAQTDNSLLQRTRSRGGCGWNWGCAGVVVGWIPPGSDRGKRGNPRQQGGSLWGLARACLQMCMQRQAPGVPFFRAAACLPATGPVVQEKKTPVRFGTALCFFRVSREHLRWRTRQSAVSETLLPGTAGSAGSLGDAGRHGCSVIALTTWHQLRASSLNRVYYHRRRSYRSVGRLPI